MSEPRPAIPAQVQKVALDHLLHLNQHPDDRAARDHWRRWRDADPVHARAWDKAQRAWIAAGALPAPPRRRALLRGAIACALAASVVLALTGLLVPAPEAIREIRLEDGSRVVLDSGSRLDVGFAAHAREVTLRQGEAFFQVERDVDRPFRVRAGGITVTVLGTAFDVRMDARTIRVAVAGGKVLVDGGQPQGARHLLPGQGIDVDRKTGNMTSVTVSGDSIAAWQDGKLVVDNMPLAQLADILNRHYRGHLHITDTILAQRRITGVFDLRNPVSALRAAAAAHGGTVREWAGLLGVLSPG